MIKTLLKSPDLEMPTSLIEFPIIYQEETSILRCTRLRKTSHKLTN